MNRKHKGKEEMKKLPVSLIIEREQMKKQIYNMAIKTEQTQQFWVIIRTTYFVVISVIAYVGDPITN